MIKITIKAGNMDELLRAARLYTLKFEDVSVSKIKEKPYGYQVYLTLPNLQEKAKKAII